MLSAVEIGKYHEYEAANWIPKKDLLISKWSESSVELQEHTEEKGPIRLRRTPYLTGIVDAALENNVEQIVFCKPAQIAGTTFAILLGIYFIDQDPCPIMFVLADEDTADYIGQERIKKIIEQSPELADVADGMKFKIKASAFTFLNGAYLAMAWASSVPKLASRPIKIIIFDEIDKPGYYLTTKESTPIKLGEERTEAFHNKLIVKLSTPTIETGNIVKELESCDIVKDFHVPCPYCKTKQPLRWSVQFNWGFDEGKYRDGGTGQMLPLGQVVWKGGRDATHDQVEAAGYQCGSCKKIWSTAEKNIAVGLGEWVARAEPDFEPKKIGFHINRIYSLLGKSGDLPKLVRAFIDAKKDPDPKVLQGFVNSTLAEPWKHTVVQVKESVLLKARTSLAPMTVPESAIGLTCGIDMQKRGFPFVVRAWDRHSTSWLIHYGLLPQWDDVENLIFNTKYPVEGKAGQFMRIWRAGIDTGGTKIDDEPSMTEQSYWFIREFGTGRGVRIYGTKGSSRPLQGKLYLGKVLEKMPSGKALVGGLRLVMLDTSDLKDVVYYRLQRAIDGKSPQAAHLHAETGNDYAKQITAEEKRVNQKGVQEWVVIRKDNHWLDAEVIAHALADPEMPGGGIKMLAAVIDDTKKREQAKVQADQTNGQRTGYQRPEWLKNR